MCKKSESITHLAVALAKFNTNVQRIEKDATNPHFKNRYSTLDAILDEVRPLLAEQGLSIIQMPSGDGDQLKLTTMLIHISGEWIESDSITMRPTKNDPQGVGSATTYARRYGLCAFLGLSTGDVDDDGNHASQPQRATQTPQNVPQSAPHNPQPTQPATPANTISDKQLSFLLVEMKKSKIEPEAVKAKFMFNSSKEIKKAQFNEILTWVQAGGDPVPVEEGALPF